MKSTVLGSNWEQVIKSHRVLALFHRPMKRGLELRKNLNLTGIDRRDNATNTGARICYDREGGLDCNFVPEATCALLTETG